MNTDTGMYVNETLGRLSDEFYTVALVVYFLAMVLFLVSLAMAAKTKTAAGEALAPAEAPAELAYAGGGGADRPAGPIAGDRTPGRIDEGPKKPRRSRSATLSAATYPVVFVGLIAHIASIVLRGVATERMPWGNMYEFISVTCAAAVVGGLVALRSVKYRPMMSFVMLPIVVMMFFGGTALYADAAPVVPALKSYWLAIHVSVISIASGIMVVSGVLSILFLVKDRWPAATEVLPSKETLDRMAYKCVVVGFPLLGIGIILGAIWAESAWGRYWGWDPKETVSFISWVIYAAYLHARATAGWRTGAAWINVAGFASVLFNLFAINLVVSGLHSYAGL
ncbi:c-type cytochrome biogenesis protein CcsB [Gordonia alkaliphila]|uniref:C-type cytochrome biogenesis protein CcsB n=1 Tax=Gordonia alkaliphila TaxID=1053547 RepID=A0ABP8Z283_9ACTN|nr:c-type cytochrome biogenesis protein CcsB [Gordonia alkaliphila]MCK0438575.1 c-type cytochrome biogenesis protein CcsB [Gordonia alkaliphila]